MAKRWLAAALAGLLVLSACSSPDSSQPPEQPNPAPGAQKPGPPPGPYPFGTVQQKAPAIEDGKVPLIRRIKTDKPYVFITMDDGAVKDPSAQSLIQQSGGHPVLFLNNRYVKGHEAYFKAILDSTGAVLGDHTVNHPNLKGKPLDFQKKEICDDADDFQSSLGIRPTLFRPPFGNYDQNTLKAAAMCGMRASVLWTASVNDGVVQFQSGDKLRPGDIVLMHFRKTFKEDYEAFIAQAKKDGLTPVPLADFLG
ncbi:polysaccharide deacetylase family protein [Amycolatopsis rubida]|uniref:Peptidoglycan/xylan/chitin deacetylase, PgdA/CDA1 family n=1 Tax=Amycolatopsis rubida TaxID=112413 RepID=A0A1I5EBU6_9PSEU|nr:MULTISPECIES: polysaccharide deacetylase family protein [Amycolatopsis]MYW97242.1 polysaccharide deacetylase family protein [Amycolatopsis rubida]NEC62227.1 polysaccharide deacetylase family protein [Amycolatopsis rubida]OAP24676.1 Bifunctional xylanase/deacetylase precursor [Amycolatopsis sp. M39]SFO08541.1 Peptidoglycan/xylan/chitin deacetylase, PgdA/CDA1 family [Amycolatopsis rubida]